MKIIFKVAFFILTAFLMIQCKNESKQESKQVVKQETKKETVKPKKKKKPVTDPLKIVGQAPTGMTAKSIVDRYFEVIGGADKARKVKTMLVKSTSKDTPTRSFDFITKYKNPNKFYQETAEKGEVFSKYAFDGKKGYSIYEGKVEDVGEEQIDELKNVHKYIFPDFDYAKGKLMGIAEVRGEKCYLIDYKGAKVYYSVDSGLRVVVIELGKDEEGKIIPMLKTYTSEYKEVDGLKFPFKTREVRPYVRSAKMNIQEIIINKGVTDKDFQL